MPASSERGRGGMRGRGSGRGSVRGRGGAIRMRRLPEGAYTGKQERVKKQLVERAKLRGQYRKLLQREGLPQDARSGIAHSSAANAESENLREAQGSRAIRNCGELDEEAADADEHAEEDDDMDQDSDDEVLAMRRQRDAGRRTASDTAAGRPRQQDKPQSRGERRAPAAPKSDRRERNLENFNARYDKQSGVRRDKAAAAARERKRKEDAVERRKLHTQRAKTYTRTGQPKMADRMANMLDQIRAMT